MLAIFIQIRITWKIQNVRPPGTHLELNKLGLSPITMRESACHKGSSRLKSVRKDFLQKNLEG